jgi:hypothetical protein
MNQKLIIITIINRRMSCKNKNNNLINMPTYVYMYNNCINIWQENTAKKSHIQIKHN